MDIYRGITGQVLTTEKEGGAEVEWRISNFSSLSSKDGVFYSSPGFSFGDHDFFFQIYPVGTRVLSTNMSIQLFLWKNPTGHLADKLHFSVSLKDVNGQKVCEQKASRKGTFDFHSFSCLIRRRELLKRKGELLPSDVLKVVCTMNWGTPAICASATATAECSHCKKSFDVDSLLSHQRKCGQRPIKCPDCLESLLLQKWLDEHECKKENKEDVVKKISFAKIRRATQNFSHELGTGSFGTVYKGEISDGGVTTQIAVKKLKGLDKQFEAELKALYSFKHDFLLSVIGYCDEPARPCIVLEYMANGSLEDRLACKKNVQPLSWDVRLVIAYCSALGINHLHTSGQVHRDVKSANILLDKDLFPKVADFGLVRIGESGESTIIQVTKNVCGTPAYMAPEAYDGDVSAKLDTFSFGVVLLELLTGLPARHGGKRLFLYEDRLLKMLDDKAKWDTSIAKELYKISKSCLIREKRDRPTISQIFPDLRAILPASVRMLIMRSHPCP